ncbi:hypothetical protein, partial [Acetobacter aceti]|uniref:hypothetical protein n=1 Tax=Acetobacter aceti TaxID=435 RepID=UPI0019D709FF
VAWSSSCSFRFSKTGRTAHAGADRVRDRRRRPDCRRVGEPILSGAPGTGASGKIGGTTRP